MKAGVTGLIGLLLCGCDRKQDATPAASPVRDEDRILIAAGMTADAIAAARAYLKPFTHTDQAECFDSVEATGAAMEQPASTAFAASPAVTRVVVAIDGSGSMAADIGGRSKLARAKDATLAFIDSLGKDVELSVLAFGQQGDNTDGGKAQSCRGIDTIAAMSRDRTAQRQAVASVRAVGWTPLAAALQDAKGQFGKMPPGEQVVYVVSDGNETCGGNPVAAARAINTGDTRAIVNIIGFDLPAADRAALTAVAQAGGGTLVNIADDAAYRRMLAATREAGRLTMNTVRASNAKSRTLIDTGAAITRATICTGAIVTRETLDVGADLTRRAAARQSVPDRRTVFAVLEQRHKAMTARREAFETRLKADRDRSNRGIDVVEKAAR